MVRRGRPASSLTKEEKLAKQREAARKRRAKRRADPQLQAEDKLKEHLRYKKRKQQGKIKQISQLTPRQQRVQRKKWRENISRYRYKHKITQQCLENTPHTSDELDQSRFSRNEAGRKRVKRERSKTYRKLQYEIKKNTTLKLKNDAIRKKYERLIKKLKKCNVLTPRTKINALMQNNTPENRNTIKKKLIFGEVLDKQLTERAATFRTKEKQLFMKLLGGDILKKYRCLMEAGHFFPYNCYRTIRSRTCKSISYERALKKSALETKSKVYKFLLNDEQSTMCPGKKDFVIVKKQKIQKRYYNETLKNLYKQFLKSHKKKKISYSTFCRFKPPNIFVPKLTSRDTCLCIKHENFKLLVSKLYAENIITSVSPTELIASICCDIQTEECMIRKCSVCSFKKLQFSQFDPEKSFKYKLWKNTREEREIKGTMKFVKRLIKCEIETSLENVVRTLKTEIIFFMKHVNNMNHQCTASSNLKKREANELNFHIDFSENYCCKCWAEPQSVHFGASRMQLSLHTGVCYTKNSTTSFATVSANLRHDAKAVLAHLMPILSHMMENFKTIDTLNFISDGPSGQYRNRTMFTIIGKFLPQLFPQIQNITWNYCESGHGKGPADGIGGCLKRTADRLVAYRNDIQDLQTFVNMLEKEESKIKLIVVNDKDFEEIDSLVLDSALISPVKKTMQIHQVTWNNRHNTLHFNSLSCTVCMPGEDCPHYSVAHPVALDECQMSREGSPRTSQDSPTTPDTLLNIPGNSPSFSSSSVKEADWVAVVYERDWFPGIVEKVKQDEITVNFLARSGKNSFYWPDVADRQIISPAGILYKLKDHPIPISSRLMCVSEHKYIDFLSNDLN